jgi:hydrogenase maturation protease
MTAAMRTILVMGVGNPLMRDDGVGPRVIELLLTGYSFPDNVELVDAGTMSFMILDLLRGVDDLILVDAMQDTESPAGTVAVLSPEEIAPNQVKHSMHDVGIVDVLQAAELMERAPKTVAIGVQIESIEQWVLELSDPVAAAVPIAAAAVLGELKQLGIVPVPSDDADAHAQILSALRTYAPMPDTTSRKDESGD